MDRQLRTEIVATVKRSLQEALETYDERWLTDEQIGEYIGCLSKRWLRDHGDILPRTRMEWTDSKGGKHASSWLYPLHKIQAMIADGRIKELKEAI